MKKVLIFWGGWDGHDPKGCADVIGAGMEKRGYAVTIEDNMNSLESAESAKSFDLIMPIWTMGEMPGECAKNLLDAVTDGTGFAGFHGGAGDAFRGNLSYEWMVGGHFVGHPYVGKYTVELTGEKSEITAALPESFEYDSEQYYMMIDPAINVLATTQYDYNGKKVTMPVIWTSLWGKGKVFYSALGHASREFVEYPDVLEMTLRGMDWACR